MGCFADGGRRCELKRDGDWLAGQRDAHWRSHNGVKIHAGCGGDRLDECDQGRIGRLQVPYKFLVVHTMFIAGDDLFSDMPITPDGA